MLEGSCIMSLLRMRTKTHKNPTYSILEIFREVPSLSQPGYLTLRFTSAAECEVGRGLRSAP